MVRIRVATLRLVVSVVLRCFGIGSTDEMVNRTRWNDADGAGDDDEDNNSKQPAFVLVLWVRKEAIMVCW